MYDLYFLICDNDKLLDKIYKGDLFMENVIKNAREIAGKEKLTLFLTEDEIIKKDEDFIRSESYDQGIQEGIEQGIQEGILQNQISIINNLFAKKMSLKNISEIVNLSVNDVKKIINNQKK